MSSEQSSQQQSHSHQRTTVTQQTISTKSVQVAVTQQQQQQQQQQATTLVQATGSTTHQQASLQVRPITHTNLSPTRNAAPAVHQVRPITHVNMSPPQNVPVQTTLQTVPISNVNLIPQLTSTTPTNYQPYQVTQYGYAPQFISSTLVERQHPIIQTVREVVVNTDQSARIKELEILVNQLYQELDLYQSQISEHETYQTTIRVELEKVHTYESRITMLIEENNNLQKNMNDFNLINMKFQQSLSTIKYYETEHSKWQEFINMKTGENENLKQQLIQLEYAYKQLQMADAEKQAKIDDLTGNLDLTRKSHVENVKRSEIITRKRIETLEEELREVKRLLDQANLDIQNWHGKFLQAENEKQEQINRNLHLEDQMNLLTQEMDRILNTLKAQTEELDTYQKKCSQLQTQLFVIQSLEAEINHLREVISTREREIDDWKSRYTKQIQTVDELRRSNSVIPDYENQANMLTNEIERLHSIIQQRQEEIDTLKQTIYKYEVSINQYKSIEQDKILLENQVTLLAQEIERLTNMNNKRLDEIDSYKIRISQYQVEISSLTTYQSEVQRLREYLDNRNRDYEELRRQNQTLELDVHTRDDRIQELENKVALLSTEIERISNLNQSKYDQLEEWKRRCIQLESSINSLQSVEEDNKRLREFLEMTNRERDDLRSKLQKAQRDLFQVNAQRSELENKVAILSTEIQRLLGIINDRNKTIETHKTTTTQLELRITELRSLESRTQEYEYKLNLLTGELERLSNAYRSKCEELDQAGLRISRLELENSQIGVFESDNKRLREIIDQLQRDNNDLREKIFKLEQVISELRKFELLQIELENKIAMLSTEIERKDGLIRTRNEEMETLRKKIQQLQIAMYQVRDYEERIQVLSSEIDRVTLLHRQSEDELRTWRFKYVEINELQNRVQELLVQLVLSNSIIEALSSQLQDSTDLQNEETRRSLGSSNQFR